MMRVTRCPRCGNDIIPKQRFCSVCGLSVQEAERVLNNLSNNPVPFRLDEYRRSYAASKANKHVGNQGKRLFGDSTDNPSGGAKVTRCLRCGNKIAAKQRFCPECGLPVWEANRISDNLSNKPVPFRLSDEHRRIYTVSKSDGLTGDWMKRSPQNRIKKSTGEAKKSFVLLGLIVALALLAAAIIVSHINNKNKREMSVQQSESGQTIENTEAMKLSEVEEIQTEAKETEQTEQIVAETEELEEKITEKKFLVTVENGSGDGYYYSGERVQITAVVPENSGLEFSGWKVTEGDVVLSENSKETAYFIMPKENVSITAGLSEIKYTVKVTGGEGGGDYSAGDKVTLKAEEPKQNYIFDGWEIKSGDIFLSEQSSNITFFYMPRGDVEISAVYKEITYDVTVRNGTGGRAYHAGDTVTITANPAEDGYEFDGWRVVSGDINLRSDKSLSAEFVMPEENVTVEARYKEREIPTYELKVKNGSGSGSQHAGDSVSITALPPESNSSFNGWVVESGDVEILEPEKESITIVMPDEDVVIRADYTEKSQEEQINDLMFEKWRETGKELCSDCHLISKDNKIDYSTDSIESIRLNLESYDESTLDNFRINVKERRSIDDPSSSEYCSYEFPATEFRYPLPNMPIITVDVSTGKRRIAWECWEQMLVEFGAFPYIDGCTLLSSMETILNYYGITQDMLDWLDYGKEGETGTKQFPETDVNLSYYHKGDYYYIEIGVPDDIANANSFQIHSIAFEFSVITDYLNPVLSRIEICV